VPVYVICNNRLLAAIVAARPQSLAALGEIEGIGKAKLEQYGADMLAVLSRTQAGAAADEPPSPPSSDEAVEEKT
jgi:ATP-dependent DNA helicase RecQ